MVRLGSKRLASRRMCTRYLSLDKKTTFVFFESAIELIQARNFVTLKAICPSSNMVL